MLICIVGRKAEEGISQAVCSWLQLPGTRRAMARPDDVLRPQAEHNLLRHSYTCIPCALVNVVCSGRLQQWHTRCERLHETLMIYHRS